MKEKTKKALKIVYLVVKILVVSFAAIILFFFYIFGLFGAAPNVYYSSFVLIAAGVALAAAWILPFKKVRFGFLFSGLAVLLAGVIAIGSCLGYNAHQKSITIKGDGAIDTREYLAFDPNSKIARLDHEASLRFTMEDKLPVVDGAAAFFPLYSSFVEATYPSEIPALNDYNADRMEKGPYRYSNTISGYYALIDGFVDILFAFGPDEQQKTSPQTRAWNSNSSRWGRTGLYFSTTLKIP